MSQNSKVKATIEAKKKANREYESMDEVVQLEKRTMQIANFETNSQKKIEQRVRKDRGISLKKDYGKELYHRKRELADMYNREMEIWQDEFMARVETQDDRKSRIMERAYKLRDERERVRNEHVKISLDKQWREACDDARTLDSEALLKQVSQERHDQIEKKVALKQKLTAEEREHTTAWLKHVEAMEQIEAQKDIDRVINERQTASLISLQIDSNKQKKAAIREQIKRDDAQEIQTIRDALEEEERLQQTHHLEAAVRRKEILKANSSVKEMEEAEERMRKAQDVALLRFALAKEREQQDAEEAKRNANRQAAREYKKYLEQQMIRDAEDNANLDEMRKKEEEKVWKARDDAMSERKAARDHLMNMVDEGRQEQIRMKNENEMNEVESEKIWTEKFIKEAEEGILKEKVEAEARRRIAQQNQEKLKGQINFRSQKEEKLKQDDYLANKHMLRMEALHQQKLSDQGGVARTFRPLKQSQWYS